MPIVVMLLQHDHAWPSIILFSWILFCQCCPFAVLSALFVHLFFSLLVILSYTTPQRVPEKEFLKAFKSNPRLKTKVNNFNRQMASNNNSEDEFVAIRPEWTTVDRILACRLTHLKPFWNKHTKKMYFWFYSAFSYSYFWLFVKI